MAAHDRGHDCDTVMREQELKVNQLELHNVQLEHRLQYVQEDLARTGWDQFSSCEAVFSLLLIALLCLVYRREARQRQYQLIAALGVQRELGVLLDTLLAVNVGTFNPFLPPRIECMAAEETSFHMFVAAPKL